MRTLRVALLLRLCQYGFILNFPKVIAINRPITKQPIIFTTKVPKGKFAPILEAIQLAVKYLQTAPVAPPIAIKNIPTIFFIPLP